MEEGNQKEKWRIIQENKALFKCLKCTRNSQNSVKCHLKPTNSIKEVPLLRMNLFQAKIK